MPSTNYGGEQVFYWPSTGGGVSGGSTSVTTYLRYGAIALADLRSDQLSAAAIASIEADAITQEDFQQGKLSQLKRIIYGDNAGYWNDDFGGASIRSLKELHESMAGGSDVKSFLRRIQLGTDITIPSGQNYKVLSVSGNEVPSGRNLALDSATTEGLVAAKLGAGELGSHKLTAISGNSPTIYKNMVPVRIADSNQDLTTSTGLKVFALLQAESTAVSGQAPNDANSGNRLQISLVARDPATDSLVAAPIGDVEGKAIELQFTDRQKYVDMDEDALLGIMPYADAPVSAVTRQAAYVGGAQVDVVGSEGDVTENLAEDGTTLKVQRGGAAFYTLTRNDALTGDLWAIETDRMTVDTTQSATFYKGVRADTADGSIDIGHVAAGKISRATSLAIEAMAGSLTMTATGATSDVMVSAGRDLKLTDARFSALPLSDGSSGATGGADWIARLGNPVSLVQAINRAACLGGKDMRYGNKFHSGGTVSLGSNVAGGGFFDFTTQSDEDTLVFYNADRSLINCFVALNGQTLKSGSDGTNGVVWLGDNPDQGDLKFNRIIRNNDFIEAWCHISSQGTP